jgi:hypothetical protein
MLQFSFAALGVSLIVAALLHQDVTRGELTPHQRRRLLQIRD